MAQVSKKVVILSAVGAVAVAAVTVVAVGLAGNAASAQPTVGLGSTANYAVLAGSGITNTGPTTVSGTAGGDLGSSPTGTFTGDTDVTTTGTKFTAVNAQTTAAKVDLVTAYDDAAGRIPANTVTGDLGGQTLTSGVYKAATAMGLTGTVTLDAENDPDAVFIFQAGSTLTTATSSTVALINGAQACHVFWQVGSSATFGTTTDFVGHVLALTSITANHNAVFHGQLLARNGAVTLDANTIVNDSCATVVPTGTASASATPSDTASPSASPSDTPTASASPTSSASPSASASSTSTPVATPTTTNGGGLPNTDAPDFSTPLFAGLGLALVGSIVLIVRRRMLS